MSMRARSPCDFTDPDIASPPLTKFMIPRLAPETAAQSQREFHDMNGIFRRIAGCAVESPDAATPARMFGGPRRHSLPTAVRANRSCLRRGCNALGIHCAVLRTKRLMSALAPAPRP